MDRGCLPDVVSRGICPSLTDMELVRGLLDRMSSSCWAAKL